MPRARIFFDIMLDLSLFECIFQPCRGTFWNHPVAAAEARDHRTRAIQERIDVVRDMAVVRGYCRKSVADRQKDRKSSARTEADDPRLAGTVLAVYQPLPYGIYIIKGRSFLGRQVRH
jgi:hypothetical protein